MCQTKKEFSNFKSQLAAEFYAGSFKNQLNRKLGSQSRLIVKQIPVNLKKRKNIDIHYSEDVK